MGIKIEDLPPRLQAQARAQLGRMQKSAVGTLDSETRRQRIESREIRLRKPNKTEADYRSSHLRGMDSRYEALTFRMANGHRYTPDWVVFSNGRPVACHECKGGYSLQSQQRARLAFDQVRIEFPWVKWVWAVKSEDGWKVED